MISNYVTLNSNSTNLQKNIYGATAEAPRKIMAIAFAIAALAFSILMIKVLMIAGTTAGLTYGFAFDTLSFTLNGTCTGTLFLGVSLTRDVFAGTCIAIEKRDAWSGLRAFGNEWSQTWSDFTSVGNWIARKCYRIATI